MCNLLPLGHYFIHSFCYLVFYLCSNHSSLFSFPPVQDDSTSHSDHQDPISLAVEMAAVNHTILALARLGANEIKTEALDDD